MKLQVALVAGAVNISLHAFQCLESSMMFVGGAGNVAICTANYYICLRPGDYWWCILASKVFPMLLVFLLREGRKEWMEGYFNRQ